MRRHSIAIFVRIFQSWSKPVTSGSSGNLNINFGCSKVLLLEINVWVRYLNNGFLNITTVLIACAMGSNCSTASWLLRYNKADKINNYYIDAVFNTLMSLQFSRRTRRLFIALTTGPVRTSSALPVLQFKLPPQCRHTTRSIRWAVGGEWRREWRRCHAIHRLNNGARNHGNGRAVRRRSVRRSSPSWTKDIVSVQCRRASYLPLLRRQLTSHWHESAVFEPSH